MLQPKMKKIYIITIFMGLILTFGIFANTYYSDTNILTNILNIDKIGGRTTKFINTPVDNATLRFFSSENDLYNEGNPIEFINQKNSSKAYLTWIDNSTGDMQEIGWIGCHNVSLTDAGNKHQHCSIEVLDAKNTLNSHLTVTWGTEYDGGSTYVPGIYNKTTIMFPNSQIQLSNNQHIILGNSQNEVMYYDSVIGSLRLWSNDGNAKLNLYDASTNTSVNLWADANTGFVGTATGYAKVFKIMTNGTSKIEVGVDGTVKLLKTYNGTGNAYACLNENGTIYRSGSACV